MNRFSKEIDNLIEYKNTVPLIKNITSGTIEKVFLFFVYIYIFLIAVRSVYNIFAVLSFSNFQASSILVILNYLIIVIVALIILLKKRAYNWIILELLLINLL